MEFISREAALLDGSEDPPGFTGTECPTGIPYSCTVAATLAYSGEISAAQAVLVATRMNKILSFRDLDVWHLGMDLVDAVIADLKSMPRIEFDLKRQIQRAAISIPANIAEGWRRKKRRGAYQNHVSIAMGSQGELETQYEIAFRNSFLNRKDCARTLELCTRVGTMLNRLHDSLD